MRALQLIDIEIAEKIMGWKKEEVCIASPALPKFGWRKPNGDFETHWYPSTDISDAWKVWEHGNWSNYMIIRRVVDPPDYCSTYTIFGAADYDSTPHEQSIIMIAEADTAPEAICKAALKAVENHCSKQ